MFRCVPTSSIGRSTSRIPNMASRAGRLLRRPSRPMTILAGRAARRPGDPSPIRPPRIRRRAARSGSPTSRAAHGASRCLHLSLRRSPRRPTRGPARSQPPAPQPAPAAPVAPALPDDFMRLLARGANVPGPDLRAGSATACRAARHPAAARHREPASAAQCAPAGQAPLARVEPDHDPGPRQQPAEVLAHDRGCAAHHVRPATKSYLDARRRSTKASAT